MDILITSAAFALMLFSHLLKCINSKKLDMYWQKHNKIKKC